METLLSIMIWVIGIPLGLFLLVFVLAAIAGTVGGPPKPYDTTWEEVAKVIKQFLYGGGGAYDWDDFTTFPISDPYLENIRQRCGELDLPLTEDGEKALEELLEKLERKIADKPNNSSETIPQK